MVTQAKRVPSPLAQQEGSGKPAEERANNKKKPHNYLRQADNQRRAGCEAHYLPLITI